MIKMFVLVTFFIRLNFFVRTQDYFRQTKSLLLNIKEDWATNSSDVVGETNLRTLWLSYGITTQLNSKHSLQIYNDLVLKKLFPIERSLQELKMAVAKLHDEHKFRDYALSETEYYPDRSNRSLPVEIVIQFSDVNKVNLNTSFMQIPTDLFRQRSDLLNEIQWSQFLDETFERLRVENPQLTWQYFGFVTGASRNYPGSHLKTE